MVGKRDTYFQVEDLAKTSILSKVKLTVLRGAFNVFIEGGVVDLNVVFSDKE